MKTLKKTLFNFLKVAVTILLLYFVYTKIAFEDIFEIVKKINVYYFILAFISFFMSQIISSYRLLLHLRTLAFCLSVKSNLRLYLIGMFYNFFIPGGVGGDAYKVYALNKEFKWKLKPLGLTVFTDRVSGLMAIVFWIVILSMNIEVIKKKYGFVLVPLVVIIGYFVSKLIFQKVFPSFKTIFNTTLFYSFVTQGLQLISVVFILRSLNLDLYYTEYLMLFLVSSILSVFSFSGIGVREYVFLYAATILPINAGISVSVGFVFTIITATIAVFGIIPVLIKKKLTLTA